MLEISGLLLKKMSTYNELPNARPMHLNLFPYRIHKPVIMDLNVMRIPIKTNGQGKLEHYLRVKDKIQTTYEEATKSSQKFVIPKLKSFKQKYLPMCCNGTTAKDPFDKTHIHFEFKILQLLDTLQTYLNGTIKSPRRILEIKLLEYDTINRNQSE